MMHNSLSRGNSISLGWQWAALTEIGVVALLISFQIHGICVLEIGDLSIAPWDWAIVALAALFVASIFLSKDKIRINRDFFAVSLLASLFTLYLGVCVLFSTDPSWAFTLLIQQMRNLVLLFAIGTLLSKGMSFESLNWKILLVSSVIATIAVWMYLLAWFSCSGFVSSPELWKPGIIYIMDQGAAMRLIGFEGDPNFYSLWIALPFFIGFTQHISLRNLAMLSILGLSLAMAMSRGFAVGLLISTMILFFSMLITGEPSKGYLRRLLAVIVGVAIMVVALQFLAGYDISQFVRRIELISSTPRWAMWDQIPNILLRDWNPIVGIGSRGLQIALGEYSHNSYLDVLLDTGLVGFLFWCLLTAHITLCALKRLEQLELVPWIHTWLVLLVMYSAFSLVYNPLPWLLGGVLTTKVYRNPRTAAK